MKKTGKKVKKKRVPKKRPYNNDPREKIKKGVIWKLPVELHPDVALKIIEENDKTTKEYGRIVNEKLAEAYGITI